MPIRASAAELAILSKLPADTTEELLDERGLEACTPETITDCRALNDELGKIEK